MVDNYEFSYVYDPFRFIWVFFFYHHASYIERITSLNRSLESVIGIVQSDNTHYPWHMVVDFLPITQMHHQCKLLRMPCLFVLRPIIDEAKYGLNKYGYEHIAIARPMTRRAMYRAL